MALTGGMGLDADMVMGAQEMIPAGLAAIYTLGRFIVKAFGS